MHDLTLLFIISQVLASIAIGFDFLSQQFKRREQTILCLFIGIILLSTHFFLLHRVAAGVILLISALRYVTCYFTTDKKYLFLFIALNTTSLLFTYKNPTDLIIYFSATIITVAIFQADNKLMRKLLICGTLMGALYDAIIFSPIATIADGTFLLSAFTGYYRHYVKNNGTTLKRK